MDDTATHSEHPQSPENHATPTVTVTHGVVRGQRRQHDAVFRAIPYAGPLEGEARFAAPTPVTPWEGILDCQEPGPNCQRCTANPSSSIPESVRAGSNQLSLTVFTPSTALSHEPSSSRGLRPVFVWFHGGGFTAGDSASEWWDGARFTSQDAVVVVPNYRLDVEGWLPLPDAPHNRGLLDQIAALRWVQDNISAFGGDPARVTIGGQSAGGTGVLSLMSSPLAEGLFQQVFACSPAFIRLPQKESGASIVRRARRVFPFQDFTASALLTIPSDKLVQLSTTMQKKHPLGMPFYPVIDPDTVPASLGTTCRTSPALDYPLLIGATSEEFDGVRLTGVKRLLTRMAVGLCLKAAGISRLGRRRAVAAHHDDVHQGRLGAVLTDAIIRSTIATVAEGRVLDQPAGTRAHTWVYDYRWPGRRGAVHCADLPLWWQNAGATGASKLIGSVDQPPSDSPLTPSDATIADPEGQQLSEMMHRALVRFLHEGRPGWPAYTELTRVCMVWDENPHVDSDCYMHQRMNWRIH